MNQTVGTLNQNGNVFVNEKRVLGMPRIPEVEGRPTYYFEARDDRFPEDYTKHPTERSQIKGSSLFQEDVFPMDLRRCLP